MLSAAFPHRPFRNDTRTNDDAMPVYGDLFREFIDEFICRKEFAAEILSDRISPFFLMFSFRVWIWTAMALTIPAANLLLGSLITEGIVFLRA